MKECKNCINYVPGYTFPCSKFLDRYSAVLKDKLEKCPDFNETHDNITKIEKDFEKLFGVEI